MPEEKPCECAFCRIRDQLPATLSTMELSSFILSMCDLYDLTTEQVVTVFKLSMDRWVMTEAIELVEEKIGDVAGGEMPNVRVFTSLDELAAAIEGRIAEANKLKH